MSIKKIVQVCALTVILAAGSAAAQTAGSVNVTTSPVTSSIGSGTGVNFGTITLSPVQGGGDVTSIPITITGSNGGVANNLSNCQVFNNAGTSLTSNNVVNTIAGANTFVFNAPLAVNASTGTTTLTVRCNVASTSPSTSMFSISAGAASLGPVLRVNLDTAPTVPAGSQDVTLANISIGATGASYNLTSIPLVITASANGSTANLTDCKIRNTANLDGAVSNTIAIANGAANTFTFGVPMLITAGTANMFALTCDVQPATAVGSAYTIAVTPGNVTATNASTGATVTPVGIAAGGFGPNGLPASTSGSVVVTVAGSNPVPPTDTGSTPGVPNTGLGGSITLLAEIVLAGLVALMGAFYLGRKQA